MGNCVSDENPWTNFPGCHRHGIASGVSSGHLVGTGSSSVHTGGVLDMIYCNQTRVISCGDDNVIASFIWDNVASCNDSSTQYLRGHSRAVNRVVYSNVTNTLWSCSRDLSLRSWRIGSSDDPDWKRTTAEIEAGSEDLNPNKNMNIKVENAHSLNIGSLDVSVDGNRVVTGSRDYSVKVWDSTNLKVVTQFSRPRNVVTFCRFDQSGQIIYQGSEDLAVRVWDLRQSGSNSKPASTLLGYVYFPLCGALSSDGNYLATGCKGFESLGCDLNVWDLRKGETSRPHLSFSGHGMDVNNCTFVNTNTVFSTSKDGSVMLSNIKTDGTETRVETETTRVDAEKNCFTLAGPNLMSMAVAPADTSTGAGAGVSSGDSTLRYGTIGYLDGSMLEISIDSTKPAATGVFVQRHMEAAVNMNEAL